MTDARKRAKGKGKAPGTGTARARKGDEPRYVAREEPLVFPEDPPPVAKAARIALPPSGLAADILAMADAAAVSPAIPASDPSPATPEPSQAAARSHNISFFAAPVREERKAAEATEHLATFFLSREEYCVDVRLCRRSSASPDHPVPRAPESIKGVINLRGRIIPSSTSRMKLGLGDVGPDRRARSVVVKLRDPPGGLLVDAASQVLRCRYPASIGPRAVVEIDAEFIRGVAKLPDRLSS